MQSAALLVARPSDEYPEYRTRYVDLRVEDHKDPIRELRRVFGILESTDLAEAHLRYASAYDKAGRKDLAKVERDRVGEALRRALERGEKDASNLNGLAWVCATNDIYLEEALRAAERAVALEPKESGILDTLAEVHFRMGHADKAIEVETRALALEPDSNYLKEQIARFKAGPK
jgi:tetratricopeptide (TPR) repeat protein